MQRCLQMPARPGLSQGFHGPLRQPGMLRTASQTRQRRVVALATVSSHQREQQCASMCMHALPASTALLQPKSGPSTRRLRRALQAAAVDSATTDTAQPPTSSASAAAAGGSDGGQMSQRRILQGISAERLQRLEALVELKRLYRNVIRAEALLALPSPVYTPPEEPPADAAGDSAAAAASSDSYTSSSTSNGTSSSSSSSPGSSPGSSQSSMDDEVAERVQQAVEVVAEMQLTAEQLKTGLRTLSLPAMSSLFGADGAAVDEAVRDTAKRCSTELRQRAAQELPLLPFSSEAQAQAACDVRNSRYDKRLQAAVEELAESAGSGPGLPPSNSFPDRLNQAEKVAGKFVAKRIRPALQRAREKELPELLSESRDYLKGLWSRLNGGTAGGSRKALPPELKLPANSQKEVDKRIHELRLKLEALDKRLVEASKAREARLRKAGAAGRVAVAIQLRSMDAEVVAISRLLAVGALQLEMEYIFSGLEEEALDISGGELRNAFKGPALARENTTGELALLVAEYGLLLEQLDVLAESIASQMAPLDSSNNHNHGMPAPQPPVAAAAAAAATTAGSSTTAAAAAAGGQAGAGKSPGLSIVNDDLLTELAAEIPDLRYRVGVSDAEVFGANPLSPTRLKLQVRENSLKVLEGVSFLTRGVRLLLSDVGNGGRLFTKAALGGTLRPREVAALRRTARDLLSFIPFVIILIIPLTPLGHVLVFGFIQRYFPGFFPSQFTNQRQDLMMRYEELQRQLVDAQAAAEIEEEEAELARAAAAVARLVAPDSNPSATAGGSPAASAAAAGSGGNTPLRGGTNSSSNSSTRGPSGAASIDLGGGVAGGSGAATAGGTTVSSVDEEGSGPAAAKLRLLEQEVEEARQEVHAADADDEKPSAGLSMRH